MHASGQLIFCLAGSLTLLWSIRIWWKCLDKKYNGPWSARRRRYVAAGLAISVMSVATILLNLLGDRRMQWYGQLTYGAEMFVVTLLPCTMEACNKSKTAMALRNIGFFAIGIFIIACSLVLLTLKPPA
jgi:hypothetical protein